MAPTTKMLTTFQAQDSRCLLDRTGLSGYYTEGPKCNLRVPHNLHVKYPFPRFGTNVILFTHMTCPAKVPHCLHVKYPFRRFMNEQLIFVRARLVPLCGNICLLDVNQPTTHQHEGMTTKLDSI